MTDTWLYDSGDAIAEAAKLAVDTATGSGDIPKYVSLGRPPVDFCDRLTIHLVNLGITPSSQKVVNTSSGCAPGILPVYLGNWEVQLWRNCWPCLAVVNDTIIPPALDALTAASESLHSQAAAMYAALWQGYANGFPDLPACVSDVTIGALTPLGPEGTAVGWRVPVALEYG